MSLNQEKLERILRKLKEAAREMDEVYDFLATLEALTTDKDTADRIRRFMEKKELWDKIEE
jgi:cell fate (sporulation/competence/biofilm development) regulator YlbF (YheA/YmcA/DUF963 family)